MTAILAIGAGFIIWKVVANRTVILRLSDIQSREYPTSQAAAEFSRLVKERTNGRINIEVHCDGRLFDSETESVAALMQGKLDFARVSGSALSEISTKINLIQLPYLFKNREHQIRTMNSKIGRNIMNSVKDEENGIECLCWYEAGARSFYLQKEIRTAEDMTGLKIRIQKNPIMAEMCSLFGATGVQGINPSDVYRSILNGIVDGAENNIPTYQNIGDYQAAQFFVRNEHCRIPDFLLASKKTLEKLCDSDRAIIQQCALETEKFEQELWTKKEAESEKIVREAGNEIIDLTEDEIATFKTAVLPIYDKFEREHGEILSEIRSLE